MMPYEIISGEYRSNCYIEAFKQKLLHPITVKLVFIPRRKGHPVPHCMWSSADYDYDFSDLSDHTSNNILDYIVYRGYVRRFRKGFAERWKAKVINERG